jgi:hypothetical protein
LKSKADKANETTPPAEISSQDGPAPLPVNRKKRLHVSGNKNRNNGDDEYMQ